MTLQEKITAYKAEFKKNVPAEAQETMKKATEDLEASGILSNTIKVGDLAPDFSLKDAKGRETSLSGLLDKGPVVLGFYRGRW
jgi:hypothetical protein